MMVNRDEDLSATTFDGVTYFVVPEPLVDDWDKYVSTHPGYEPTGEEGSHVKWDYTEWLAPSRIADKGIEFLYQMLLIFEGE
jgi:hypothetical protein